MESWRNRKTLILSRTDMMGLLTPADYVACVEQAYRMHGEGRFYMDPKGHIVLDKYPGEWEAMPSYIEEPQAAACKWVSIRERNREKYDLPTVFSILIYTHPETGLPLAICDGSYRTVMCTGAAAVSVKWMARKNSKRLAIAEPAIWPRHTRHLQCDFPVGGGAGVEPVSNRRRNQRAVAPGADKRERYSRRDPRGHYRSQAGTAFGGRNHSLRLYRNCASGLGDGAARV